MSRVVRKRFFGVHAPDSPSCDHVDTETNGNLFFFFSILSSLILEHYDRETFFYPKPQGLVKETIRLDLNHLN